MMTALHDRKGKAPESRRHFLRVSTGAMVGAGMAGALSSVHAGGNDVLRVGLIGCGGRGTGAAHDAMRADKGVRITALGDAFADRLEASKNRLREVGKEQFAVDNDHCFVGIDAFQKVIDSGVDVVLLATPPHFRPAHLKAAVAAGKHVFCEKPVAVDAPGVRSVLATCQEAKKKNLSIVSGLCWRYHKGMNETIKRVHDGQVGKIVALQCNYNAQGLWYRSLEEKAQKKWSDMEWQIRNWLYFTWLSGDHIVEQHVHSLDKMAWVMGDQYPAKCFGLGGRQARTSPDFGHIFDHHAVCYEFANGVRCFSYTRQQDGAATDVNDYVFGSKGTASLIEHTITGENPWRYNTGGGSRRRRRGDSGGDDMFLQEHQALFGSIREGKPINNGDYMTKSTLMAIMGRMATYTGKVVTWEQALNSKEDLSPSSYDFGTLPVPPVAIPGKTPLV